MLEGGRRRKQVSCRRACFLYLLDSTIYNSTTKAKINPPPKKNSFFTDLEAEEYYVSMTVKSAKSNSSGSVFYNVTATLDASVSSVLEMPMAAAAYADSMQDKLFGKTDTGLLASL